MSAAQTPQPVTAAENRRRWQAVGVGLVAAFMTLLDVSIVNVAVPSIDRALHASPSDLQWVLSGYALTFGLVLVPAGRFGDARGRRNAFVFGIALFTLTSALAGLATSPDVAGHRPARPGRRRRRRQPAGHRADPAAVPGRRAGPPVRAARRHHRHLHRRRAAARRAAHRHRRRGARLALGLLRQRAGRHRRGGARLAAAARPPRRPTRPAPTRPRRRAAARRRGGPGPAAAGAGAAVADPVEVGARPGRPGACWSPSGSGSDGTHASHEPLFDLRLFSFRSYTLGSIIGAASTSAASPRSSSSSPCSCRTASATARSSPAWPSPRSRSARRPPPRSAAGWSTASADRWSPIGLLTVVVGLAATVIGAAPRAGRPGALGHRRPAARRRHRQRPGDRPEPDAHPRPRCRCGRRAAAPACSRPGSGSAPPPASPPSARCSSPSLADSRGDWTTAFEQSLLLATGHHRARADRRADRHLAGSHNAQDLTGVRRWPAPRVAGAGQRSGVRAVLPCGGRRWCGGAGGQLFQCWATRSVACCSHWA